MQQARGVGRTKTRSESCKHWAGAKECDRGEGRAAPSARSRGEEGWLTLSTRGLSRTPQARNKEQPARTDLINALG